MISTDPDLFDVIVVGAGISGLASAWGIQQQGARVLVIEAVSRPGGCIATAHEQGCLLESGPNSALDTTPLINHLLNELDIANSRIAGNPDARNRYILRDGEPRVLPMSPFAFLTSPLFSTGAKLRLLREPFIARGTSDAEETVAAFVRRRLGAEFLDYAINPFVGGVYAGNPEMLSLSAAFPRLHQLEQEHGSLIRGQLLGALARARSPEKSKKSAPTFSFREGMQTMTDAMARHLRIELGAQVISVTAGDNGYTISTDSSGMRREFRSRAVLLAVPAYVAASLVASIAPHTAQALADIPYPPVAVIHSAYHRSAITHPLDGFGLLVPACERRQILGTLFSSSLFDNRAPHERVLLTTFMGGMRQPDLTQLGEREIARIAQADNAQLLGIAGPAEFVKVTRWARAIPQYTLGHSERMAQVDEAERIFPGLFFCANYRGGVAVGDCIKSAHHAANATTNFLRGR
ncbi:Protoporphyrinogen oxidase [Georgfuchsia toluolica]|uniref:Protoporphyrinogen oxidase n=1 Tax=Georgfuchsia toluolica TaxID=424218 RepID=A0A916N965_9PROT|nr:protoporphyrinogen oxidase [Georgfuchsia toluolica]CAG4883495.1 Protoporphyrinogen oxidase [Georgfuchsia toluolica]